MLDSFVCNDSSSAKDKASDGKTTFSGSDARAQSLSRKEVMSSPGSSTRSTSSSRVEGGAKERGKGKSKSSSRKSSTDSVLSTLSSISHGGGLSSASAGAGVSGTASGGTGRMAKSLRRASTISARLRGVSSPVGGSTLTALGAMQ